MTTADREARRLEGAAGMPRPDPAATPSFPGSFYDGILAGDGCGIGRKEAVFLHLEIEIEGHLRRLEALVLQAIVFRLL